MNFITDEINKLEIENNLKKLLYFENPDKYSLEWGMNYITFSPSKRIRPLLLLESNLIFSDIDDDSYILAASLELIHTYSLVHDDLPCMDDDDLRRGQETLHKIIDEAYAVLIGDSLLTRSFELLSDYSKGDKINKILKLFTDKSGYKGMVYGQILDLNAEGKKLNIKEMNIINKNKTAKLFELSLIAGGINGGASENELKVLGKLGEFIGFIFQIQDDILDITGSTEELGKTVGSDEKNKKSSVPLIIGLDKSGDLLIDYYNKAVKLIKLLPTNNDFFLKLLDFLINRIK